MMKHTFTAKAYGKSMYPLISHGDTLHMQKVSKDIHVGDIVVFLQGKICISHRVVITSKKGITAKGDNIPFFDRFIPYEEVLGKVIRIVGSHGTIDLQKKYTRILQYYFLLVSLSRLYLPPLLRGRKILTKMLAR